MIKSKNSLLILLCACLSVLQSCYRDPMDNCVDGLMQEGESFERAKERCEDIAIESQLQD